MAAFASLNLRDPWFIIQLRCSIEVYQNISIGCYMFEDWYFDILFNKYKWFRVQFGINKHEQIFQRLQKIARAHRASAICSLWKICECLFIPNCTRKIIWLLVNNIQVTISDTLLYFRDKWRQPATSTLLDENLTCEFKRKNSFTLSKSCMKTEQFLLTV